MVPSGSNQKNNVRFDQYSSIEIKKADTIYCGTPFSLQTFDILRVSHKDRAFQNLIFFANINPKSICTDCIYHQIRKKANHVKWICPY
jgi:hypothetical protein